jgi:hypothetical protein
LRVANLSGPTCRRDLPEELPASRDLHAAFARDPVFRALGEGAGAGAMPRSIVASTPHRSISR